jgi:coatomer subunit beta
MTCVRVLADENETLSSVFTISCREALASMLQEQADFEATHSKAKKKKNISVQPDDPIPFLQLMSKNDIVNGDDVFEVSLSQAVGFNPKKDDTDVRRFVLRILFLYSSKKLDTNSEYSILSQFSSSKLSKVTQLTGFSDPVYAEAYINVNQFDIVLDVLIVNQTSKYYSPMERSAHTLTANY